MSGNKLLLDTNIILYLLGGDTTLKNILFDKQVFISFITEIELLGFKNLTGPETKKITAFIESCSVIDVNAYIKKAVIDLRQQHSIKIPDAIIISTAIYLDIPFMTADKSFLNIKGANIINYEK